MEKINKTFILIRNIASAIIAVIILGVVGYFMYQSYFGDRVIKSKNGFFQISVPNKMGFEEDKNEENELALYDEETDIGLWVGAYEINKETDFAVEVQKERDNVAENPEIEGGVRSKVSEVRKISVGKKDAYVYDFIFTDEENSYFIYLFYIRGDYGEYYLDFECAANLKTDNLKIIEKIAKSFKELK